MKIKLPVTVKAILDRLKAFGFEAYAVGGCIRDSILKRRPDDWDITTSARPEQVKKIFNRTVDTGITHGTVTVLVGSKAHEVTTYRIEGKYRDARHPEKVTFTDILAEDLKRRDFTINAIAYNDVDGLVDLYGGMDDLQKKMIRCVGNPMERFTEDALRILRAVRFSAELSFDIDRDTVASIICLAPSLEKISAERICAELIKLITSDHPDYLKVAYTVGITKIILPEFDEMMKTPQNNPHHCYTVGEHTLKSMCAVEADKTLRLTMLFHDIGKPFCHTTDENDIDHFKGHGDLGMEIAKAVMKRLKIDNSTMRQVILLVKYHDWRIQPEEKEVRRAVHKVGTELFPLLLKVQNADSLAQSEIYKTLKLQRIIKIFMIYKKIMKAGQCLKLKDLEITGGDILSLGGRPGPEVGELLNAALEEVLNEPDKNNKAYLLDFVKNRISQER